jgi:anti-sigma B factor antagonist
MEAQPEKLFGRIALMNGWVTKERLDECIRHQEELRAQGVEIGLGEVLVRKKYLTKAQVENVLQAQEYLNIRRDDILFGELAVKNGLATQQEVNECLGYQEYLFTQKGEMKRLGQIMVDGSYLDSQQVDAILKAQARLKASIVRSAAGSRIAGGGRDTQMMRKLAPSELHVSTAGVASGGCVLTNKMITLESDGLYKGRAVQVIEIRGVLDAHTFPYFEEMLMNLLNEGTPFFVLNCEGLDYLSSAGIGVLINVTARVREKRGDLRLAHVQPKIKSIIDIMGFSSFVRVFNDERNAVLSFKYV